MKYLTAILVAALATNATAFAQYKLEYKASGSVPLHYKAHTTLRTTEKMMGQVAKVSVATDQTISMTGEKSHGELVFDITIDSSSSIALLPNGDSSRTTSPAVGQTKRTVVRPNGEEISSVWLDSAFAATQGGQTKDLGSFFFRLPDKEVKDGATWSQSKTDTVTTGGGEGTITVTTSSDYKLVDKEIVDGITCVKIQFGGKVILKGSTVYQGIEFAINGNGTISGTAMFDYGSGRVVEINGSSVQDLTMASSGENKMTIPMNQQTNYELSLVR